MSRARDVSNIDNIPTAKGDIYAATAASTPARIGVGSNDQVLVSDSTTSTGLAWKSYGAQQVAGKNRAINGDFAINQRAFTTTSSDSVFFADRWTTGLYGGSATFTTPTIAYNSFSGQTSDKVLRITATSATNDPALKQRIEDVMTFAGQTITVSFWARSNSATYNIDLIEAFQSFGNGGSAGTYNYADVSGKTFGTSWTRISAQIAVPSVAGKTIGAGSFLQIRIDPFHNAANGSWCEITHVQVEAGSVATPFTLAGGGHQQAELALCHRYYWRSTATGQYSSFGNGYGATSTAAYFWVQHPVPMRAQPTVLEWQGIAAHNPGNFISGFSSVSLGDGGSRGNAIYADGAVGLTSFRPYFLSANNSSTAYIAFGAEL